MENVENQMNEIALREDEGGGQLGNMINRDR